MGQIRKMFAGKTFQMDGSGKFVQSKDVPRSILDHVVILNVNERLPGIVAELEAGVRDVALDIVIIVQDWKKWLDTPSWHPDRSYPGNIYYFVGGKTGEADLVHVRVEKSRTAVVLADPLLGELSDAHTTLAAVAIENMSPAVHTVVELRSSINRVHLRSTHVNEVVCVGELTEKLIAQSCISPGVKDVFEHLLSADVATTQMFAVPLPRLLQQKTYRQIARQGIVHGAPFIMCGFIRQPTDPASPEEIVLNPSVKTEPGKDTVLREGDRAIVIAPDKKDVLDFWNNWTGDWNN